MKKSIMLFTGLIFISTAAELNANPFEKMLEEFEKEIGQLDQEIDEAKKNNNKDTSKNKNLPDAFKKANSNLATYKECQQNGGKPINNQRGFYMGFYDPCLPEDYVVSPQSPQECTNSKGEIKTAASGTDPNNMCRQAVKIAEQKRIDEAKVLASNLENRIQQYKDKYIPMVQDRLDAFRQDAATNNKNIKAGYQTDEWGDNVWVGIDESQKGVRVFYDIKKDSNDECEISLEEILTTTSYDLPIKKDALYKVGGGNGPTGWPSASSMFIESNSDNFKWAMPAHENAGVQVYLEFSKPLSTEAIKSYGSFVCWGGNYLVKSASLNKEQKYECYEKSTSTTLMKGLPLTGKGVLMLGGNMRESILHTAFDDFYSGKNTDGTQTLMFSMADGTKTRVVVNPFHPEIEKAYDEMCN